MKETSVRCKLLATFLLVAGALSIAAHDATAHSANITVAARFRLHTSMPDATQVEAAQIALLALYAAVGGNGDVDRVVVEPDARERTWDEAAEDLALKSKPTQCTARMEGRVLVVVCTPISEEWTAVHGYHLDDLERHRGPIGSLKELESPARMVLINGRTHSLIVGLNAAEAWVQSYVTTLPLSVSSRPPDEVERRRGVISVIDLSRSEVLDRSSDLAHSLLELHKQGRLPGDQSR
jgi:hypothetical protein